MLFPQYKTGTGAEQSNRNSACFSQSQPSWSYLSYSFPTKEKDFSLYSTARCPSKSIWLQNTFFSLKRKKKRKPITDKENNWIDPGKVA